MIRRALEWFGGSVLVYVVVAACAAAGGASLDDGFAGSGPDGSSGVDGQDGPDGGNDDGSSSDGGNDGPDIMNPVPDAEAEEDGSRIVNSYQTTPDGLRTPSGFWDKELDVPCQFQAASDGVSRCMPTGLGVTVTNMYADSDCTQRVAFTNLTNCTPDYAVEFVVASGSTCQQGALYLQKRYAVGAARTSGIYVKGADCSAAPASYYDSFSFFLAGAEIPPSTYVAGTISHN